MAEVEQILASLGDGNTTIDTLSERVKRATELIAQCRTALRKTEDEVVALLGEQQNE
jgi:exodeoxyribonuclease VII small subunit